MMTLPSLTQPIMSAFSPLSHDKPRLPFRSPDTKSPFVQEYQGLLGSIPPSGFQQIQASLYLQLLATHSLKAIQQIQNTQAFTNPTFQSFPFMKTFPQMMMSPFLPPHLDTPALTFPKRSLRDTKSLQPSPSQYSSNTPISSPKDTKVPIISPKKRKGTSPSLTLSTKKSKAKAFVKKSKSMNDSPVSGILILKKSDLEKSKPGLLTSIKHGDIDSKFNVVDKSESTRQKLKEIENVIGDFLCKLCTQKFEDVYSLAEHRCPSIVYIEYRCTDCGKVFNCPANLASHRRWHKQKQTTSLDLDSMPSEVGSIDEHSPQSNFSA